MWGRKHRPAGSDGARVIVVGAGFAGLAAVEGLARAGAQVMLIDRNVYSTFQPLLYQVATGGLNPGDVAYPARGSGSARSPPSTPQRAGSRLPTAPSSNTTT
jgi:NADH dehydrogenase